MIWSDFYKIISQLGYPARYGTFSQAQNPPYILYGLDDRSDLMADDAHYLKITNGYLELYTTVPELDIQKQIEEHLAANGIAWDFDDQREIAEEKVWLTRWVFDFIGG